MSAVADHCFQNVPPAPLLLPLQCAVHRHGSVGSPSITSITVVSVVSVHESASPSAARSLTAPHLPVLEVYCELCTACEAAVRGVTLAWWCFVEPGGRTGLGLEARCDISLFSIHTLTHLLASTPPSLGAVRPTGERTSCVAGYGSEKRSIYVLYMGMEPVCPSASQMSAWRPASLCLTSV